MNANQDTAEQVGPLNPAAVVSWQTSCVTGALHCPLEMPRKVAFDGRVESADIAIVEPIMAPGPSAVMGVQSKREDCRSFTYGGACSHLPVQLRGLG